MASSLTKYYIDETPYLYCYDYNSANVLADAGTSISICIYDPKWKLITDDQAMTKAATGEYYYAGLTMLSTHLAGVWNYIVKETTSSIVTMTLGQFEFIAR